RRRVCRMRDRGRSRWRRSFRLAWAALAAGAWPVAAAASDAPEAAVGQPIVPQAVAVVTIRALPSADPKPGLAFQTPSPEAARTFQALDYDPVIPPGDGGAVGPNHVMTATSSRTRIFDRSGNALSTVTTVAFWQSVLPNGTSLGVSDPHVVYDPFNARWI